MYILQQWFLYVSAAWKDAWESRVFRYKILLTPAVFLLYSATTQQFGAYIESRPGIVPQDPLLRFFPITDFSAEIFLLLYSSILLFITAHLHRPYTIVRALEMHLVVAIVRQVCIYLVAWEPPHEIIVLKDILLENTVYPQEAPLTKDLFFSGHVASIWIYFLCAHPKQFKIYLIFATFCMSFMVLCMHIHYTYDVCGALIITGIIYYAPALVNYYLEKQKKKYGLSTVTQRLKNLK